MPGPKMVDDGEHRDGQDLASLNEDQQLIKDDAPVVEDVKEGEHADDEDEDEDEDEGEQGSGATKDSKQSRSEKKSRKAMLKLGMKPVTGVSRVTIKRTNNTLFVLSTPDVYNIQNSETYVLFGEANLVDLSSHMQSQTAQHVRMLDLSGVTHKSHESDSETVVDEDDKDVDDTGVEPRAIDIVMAQAGVSWAKAVVALKAYNGDIVDAIMDLTA